MFSLFSLSLLVVATRGAFVDNLDKCSIKDDNCLNKVYQKVLVEAATSGFPNFGVAPLDPLQLTNISLTVLDTVNFFVNNGSVKGVKKIVFQSTHVDLDKFLITQVILWDSLTLKATFRISGSHPLVQNFLGIKDIDGQGTGKIKFEKLRVSLTIPFKIAKDTSGSTYFSLGTKPQKSEFDVEKVSLTSDKLDIGKQDLSKMIVPYFNNNWRSNIKTMGKTIVDVLSEFYADVSNKIFSKIPSAKFVTDDLTPYVK